MLKKKFLSLSCAAALAAGIPPAFASSTFFLVVPLNAQSQAQEPVESITVSLAGAMLPKATANQAYTHSLQDYLTVTGDSSLDKSAARWSLVEGTLPTGLALDATTGAVVGVPATKTTSPASFTVLATYKGSDGQAVYSIEVGGVVLNVREISAGFKHTCAITNVGGVKCWGDNAYGQLGDNSTTPRLLPVNVVGLSTGVEHIVAGSNHTCAMMSGAVKCWGFNSTGQLGTNNTTTRLTPGSVVGLSSGVASISAGNAHTCVVTTAGAAKCWGHNGYGQLGDNSTTKRLTPVDVVGLTSGVASISAGNTHTCAVTTTGAAKCWGQNSYGALGNNSTTDRLTPVDAVGLTAGVASITTGYQHTCAMTTSGGAKCWGRNSNVQLGDNSATNRLTPVNVVGLTSGVASISAGNYHTCAVTTSGGAKCWGNNINNELGDNSTTNRSTPVNVVGLTSGVASISAGNRHTCVVMTSGAGKCWGYNASGQLGDNSTTNRKTPVDVQGP
ncbi:putative Ig domain-containing protein [Bordetella trematum]|uniref:RCC1 domain-containing protein n=1 Tax=Bordetella trematum TaxID=123899 RepID=UPI003AF3C07A